MVGKWMLGRRKARAEVTVPRREMRVEGARRTTSF
jgi:hypothetical protein